MKKAIYIILFLFILALSGCISSSETYKEQKYELADPNLVGKIVDVKIDREDNITAGETVKANLFVANIGTEKITSETVEIKAKLKTLEDFVSNLYIKTLSDEKKTTTFPVNFSENIEPETVKVLSAYFHTPGEMNNRSMAGNYEFTVILYVNGQKTDSKVYEITLHSGTPREFTPTPTPLKSTSATRTPTPTSPLTPIITEIPTPTPTPTPTPEPVLIATPTGKSVYDRVMGSIFTVSNLNINAGDKVLWDNLDDTKYTIVDMDGKIANITLKEFGKATYIFNATGDYRFGLYYTLMRTAPSVQTINVRVNASQ